MNWLNIRDDFKEAAAKPDLTNGSQVIKERQKRPRLW